MTTGGLANLILPPLPMASEIYIQPEDNLSSHRAAEIAAERWEKEGRGVSILGLCLEPEDFYDIRY